MSMKANTIRVVLNEPKILHKVQNDQFGMFLIHEWKKLINPYTPHREGNLERNVAYRPFEVEYLSPYSQYMYYGEVYVDPLYKVGGFTRDGGITWFSRPGIKKVPSGRKFNYLKDPNSHATDHWDEAAEKAGQKRKLIQAANLYLKRL